VIQSAARAGCLLLAALLNVCGVQAQPRVTPAPVRPGGNAIDRLERLSNMSPEQRARALASLPPARRAQIEKNLARLDRLTPAQRQKALNRLRRLQELSPAQREQVRDALRQFRSLPAGRRAAVGRELNVLRGMPPAARERRLNSDEVRRRFSPLEFWIISGASKLFPDRL